MLKFQALHVRSNNITVFIAFVSMLRLSWTSSQLDIPQEAIQLTSFASSEQTRSCHVYAQPTARLLILSKDMGQMLYQHD